MSASGQAIVVTIHLTSWMIKIDLLLHEALLHLNVSSICWRYGVDLLPRQTVCNRSSNAWFILWRIIREQLCYTAATFQENVMPASDTSVETSIRILETDSSHIKNPGSGALELLRTYLLALGDFDDDKKKKETEWSLLIQTHGKTLELSSDWSHQTQQKESAVRVARSHLSEDDTASFHLLQFSTKIHKVLCDNICCAVRVITNLRILSPFTNHENTFQYSSYQG